MSVILLIIAHHPIGSATMEAACTTLGHCPLPAAVLDIPPDAEPLEQQQEGEALLSKLNQGDGILLLTDIYGATPCNIARRLLQADPKRRRLVTGLNLPMLIRTMNYPDLTLDELAQKALSGAHDGILLLPELASKEQLNHA